MSILTGLTEIVDGTANGDTIDTSFTDTDGNTIALNEDARVLGYGGDDVINTGAGQDIVDGGTGNDDIDTSDGDDVIHGNVGDDTIVTGAGDDVVKGDNGDDNLLDEADTATSFAQYGESDAWSVADAGEGFRQMSQTVDTAAGEEYELTFDLSANFGSGTVSGKVEVLVDGVIIGSFDTNSAEFSQESLSFIGTGGQGTLTFREVESDAAPAGPVIHTDQPIFYYEKDVSINGQTISVDAFAAGQPLVYQTIEGTLYAFDPETEGYTKAGADAPVNINAIGFNVEDDLIYGQARQNGTDSAGNQIEKQDLVMIDASGNTYSLGGTPYGSYTGDMDDQGNLWLFHATLDRVTKVDVDQFDINGDPVSTTYKYDKGLVTDRFADVAFDPVSQSFFGIASGKTTGSAGQIVQIDIGSLSADGEPTVTYFDLTSADINGTTISGGIGGTFGAATVDRDGNLYVGLNQGDHDADSSTSSQTGAIYRVELDAETGEAHMVLLAKSPKTYSNDGAMDTRAIDPFTQIDREAGVLIKSPELKPRDNPNDAITYDDTINTGSGVDTVEGGLGEDIIVGEGSGDTLYGDDGNDQIYGGAGPDAIWNGLVSIYDEEGNRFDQFGNLLKENDDSLYGGEGDDMISGSAGHDTIDGGEGDDEIYGGTGFDFIIGGDGADVINSGSEKDVVHGGAGDDTILGRNGNDTLRGDSGNDSIDGGSHDDLIYGGTGDDNVKGGSGDDTLHGEKGNDKLNGGSGDDVITGGEGKDYLAGHIGDDSLDGGAGRDKLYGGKGADTLTGGEGSDLFVFKSSDTSNAIDTITDFARSGGESDRIDLRSFDIVDELIWKSTNMTYVAGEGVDIDLGTAGTLRVSDHDDLGSGFLDTVYDGLMF